MPVSVAAAASPLAGLRTASTTSAPSLGEHPGGLQPESPAAAGDDEAATVLALVRRPSAALRAPPGQASPYSIGAPTWTVRPTVHSRSRDWAMRARQHLAGPVAVLPLGEPDVEGDPQVGQPVALVVADLLALGDRRRRTSPSARLPVIRSTSIAPQPASAASSSSTGVKSGSSPEPTGSTPPRALVAL